MSSIWIPGKQRVQGEIVIQGCKNAVLPMMAAALLTDEEVILKNCPNITDVRSMADILRALGCEVHFQQGVLRISGGLSAHGCLPEYETGRLRASGILMGALAGGGKNVVLPKPGGCVIGERPMDLHVHALRQLGYTVSEAADATMVTGRGYRASGRIRFAYPSVGATENAILASVMLEGETEICGAAREPEIEDLAAMLNRMGARICGAGQECIRIQGVKKLKGTCYTVMPDRIVAGTYLAAAAATDGILGLRNVQPEHLAMPMRVLREMGCRIETRRESIHIRPSGYKVPVQITTGPYPKFPTDLQPLMMPVMLGARGMSIIRETVFENRMGTADELLKMGADIRRERSSAIIYGSRLHAEVVNAPDLRGGASLAVAALTAEGVTQIQNAEFINRGYEDIVRDMRSMGIRCYYES